MAGTSSGEKPLPWEDVARLEHSWLGHCDSTKFRASRYFEESIFDLADKHGLTRENVAKALEALRGKDIISDTLFKRADRVRKDRNAFTHTASLNADLDYTLRLIAVLRNCGPGLPRTGGLGRTRRGRGSSVLTLTKSRGTFRRQRLSFLLKNTLRRTGTFGSRACAIPCLSTRTNFPLVVGTTLPTPTWSKVQVLQRSQEP